MCVCFHNAIHPPPQPLRLCNVEEGILHEIDETLQNELDKEEILRKVRFNNYWNTLIIAFTSSSQAILTTHQPLIHPYLAQLLPGLISHINHRPFSLTAIPQVAAGAPTLFICRLQVTHSST